jgi:hypothetical protein
MGTGQKFYFIETEKYEIVQNSTSMIMLSGQLLGTERSE